MHLSDTVRKGRILVCRGVTLLIVDSNFLEQDRAVHNHREKGCRTWKRIRTACIVWRMKEGTTL